VRTEGIDLTYLTLPVEEVFWRMAQYREFDAAEFSLSNYISRRSHGRDDLTAIPVFPSRTFRHSAIFINAASGIESPADLAGKRIGVPEYGMTAAVWVRGMLSDEYGLSPGDMRWVVGGLEQTVRLSFGRVQPPGVPVTYAPVGSSLADLLARGEIDALVTARTPSTFDKSGGPVRRLFADPWQVEREYFRRSRVFPIMHTLVIRSEILVAHPWVANSLYKAFSQAKDLAIGNLTQANALSITLPHLLDATEQAVELMGADFWPYGLESNRLVLETLVRYLNEQQLTTAIIPIESLFPESTQRGFEV
jgi:4,5-dihydroxyphthalate decarboxylase